MPDHNSRKIYLVMKRRGEMMCVVLFVLGVEFSVLGLAPTPESQLRNSLEVMKETSTRIERELGQLAESLNTKLSEGNNTDVLNADMSVRVYGDLSDASALQERQGEVQARIAGLERELQQAQSELKNVQAQERAFTPGLTPESVLVKNVKNFLEGYQRRNVVLIAAVNQLAEEFGDHDTEARDALQNILEELKGASAATNQRIAESSTLTPPIHAANTTKTSESIRARIESISGQLAAERSSLSDITSRAELASISADTIAAISQISDARVARAQEEAAEGVQHVEALTAAVEAERKLSVGHLAAPEGVFNRLRVVNHTHSTGDMLHNTPSHWFAYRFTKPEDFILSEPLESELEAFTFTAFVRIDESSGMSGQPLSLVSISALDGSSDLTLTVTNCSLISLIVSTGSTQQTHVLSPDSALSTSRGVCGSGWHHVVFGWSGLGGEAVLYLDGKFRARSWGVLAGFKVPARANVVLGHPRITSQAAQQKGLLGDMAQVHLFTDVLSARDVVDVSDSGTYAGPIPHIVWTLNQNKGSDISSSGSLHIPASVHGGEWIGLQARPTIHPVVLPDFKTIAEAAKHIDCDPPSLPSPDPRLLFGPKGIPPLPTGLVSHPNAERSFGNPYAIVMGRSAK